MKKEVIKKAQADADSIREELKNWVVKHQATKAKEAVLAELIQATAFHIVMTSKDSEDKDRGLEMAQVTLLELAERMWNLRAAKEKEKNDMIEQALKGVNKLN